MADFPEKLNIIRGKKKVKIKLHALPQRIRHFACCNAFMNYEFAFGADKLIITHVVRMFLSTMLKTAMRIICFV